VLCSLCSASNSPTIRDNSLLIPGGFNEFRRKFPELCDASSTVLNSPQTPSSPHIQLPNFNEPNRMSGSVLSQPTFNLKGSSEGSAPDAPVTQILEHVFLGSQEDSQNPATLKRFNITKVINLSDCPKSDLIPSQNFMRIAIKDSHDGELFSLFGETLLWYKISTLSRHHCSANREQ
jgi:hypothetical protein